LHLKKKYQAKSDENDTQDNNDFGTFDNAENDQQNNFNNDQNERSGDERDASGEGSNDQVELPDIGGDDDQNDTRFDNKPFEVTIKNRSTNEEGVYYLSEQELNECFPPPLRKSKRIF